VRPTLGSYDCSHAAGTTGTTFGCIWHPAPFGSPWGDADDGQGAAGAGSGAASSDAGRAQGERVAERIGDLPVDAVYSSPLERARETAEPTAAHAGQEVKHDDGLLECDFGDWTGAALVDVAVLPEWRTVQHSPSTFRFPNGESFTEMQDRIVGAAGVLCAAHAGGVVVCFSHADPIKAAVAHALGTPLDLFQRTANCGTALTTTLRRPGKGPVSTTPRRW
jgi:broad specificity phosphatase PhoE